MAGSTAPPAIDAAPIDGEALRGLLVAGTTWLARNAAAVNALNVFPVPDGDTGTNMLLTMRAAVEAAAGAQSTEPAEVMRAAAQGAVRAAGGQGEPSGRQGPASCREVLECALSAAREAVERTPDQLALLRQAGVVDAGGEGYRLILEGIALALRGEPLPAAPTAEQPAMCPTPAAERPASWAAAAMD